jgi:hypothetical protein
VLAHLVGSCFIGFACCFFWRFFEGGNHLVIEMFAVEF